MESLLSKNLHLLYSDGIGRFYKVGEKDSLDKKTVIFINGQMDHRLQAIETATNATKSSCFQYSWYYQYDSSVHTPYIWVYDYPIYKGNKGSYNSKTFTQSLLNAINEYNLENIDIMGESVGAVIGMRASLSDRVDKVVAIHPPILSSPLANPYILYDKTLFKRINWQQKAILLALRFIVDSEFGFQKENAFGYTDIEANCNLEKVKVTGSSIYGSSKINSLEKALSDFIYQISSSPNDGVIIWNAEELRKRGFKVVEDEKPVSHLQLGNNFEYTNNLYKKLILENKN